MLDGREKASMLLTATLLLATLCSLQQLAQGAGPGVVIYPKTPLVYVNMKNPDSQELTCQTEGDLPSMFSRLKWSGPNRNDNPEELANKHIIKEEEDTDHDIRYLNFRNPTHGDSGVYYCRGAYGSDTFEASINVTFYNPIELRECAKRQSLVQGSNNAKIHCNIIGDEPKVTILKDKKPIQDYQNRYRWDESEDSLVIIGDVDASDAGTYSIIVRSKIYGALKREDITVDVNVPPKIASYTGTGPEFVGVEGEQAILRCNVTGKPQPLVYWTDPEKKNLSSVGGYVVNPELGTLFISNTKRSDDGFFECKADNAAGSDKRKVLMDVVTRPTIVSFENKTVVEGQEVTFECRSTGDPEPSFSIRKRGNNQLPYQRGDPIVKDMFTRSEGGGSNVYVHTLRIVATRSLFGLHYCNATNRAGTAERVGHLTVDHKPDLSSTSPVQYVKLGKQNSFICHVRAHPTPAVTWFIDNVQIIDPKIVLHREPDGYTHVITMTPPQQNSFQKLTCRATNTQGTSEQTITPLITTNPGEVNAQLVARTPTTIQFTFGITNEGGDKIKAFRYKAEGRSLDEHNPLYHYRIDRHNETFITAAHDLNTVYTIKNLLPYYRYTFYIRAENDVGPGDWSETSVETMKPTAPEPPVIIKPSAQKSSSGYLSEYSNGYTLRWSPPELDNGDPVTRYILKFNRLTSDSLDITSDASEPRIIEQMPDRPMFVRIGPLEANQRYRIQLQARNKIGESKPDQIIIQTRGDMPPMPESEALLPWVAEISTQTYVAFMVLGLLGLILTDLVFCFCFQMGAFHKLRTCCCPTKTNSVISDKNYT